MSEKVTKSEPKLKVLNLNYVVSRQLKTDVCSLCHNPLVYPCVTCDKKGLLSCAISEGICSHMFHTHCIDSWQKSGHQTCPTDSTTWNCTNNNIDVPNRALRRIPKKK